MNEDFMTNRKKLVILIENELDKYISGYVLDENIKKLATKLANTLISEGYIEKEYDLDLPLYDSSFGDDRICVCGHPYYRHFDTYEDMYPVGCKYCGCGNFVEKGKDES